MSWTVTIKVVECASTSTLIPGAHIMTGTDSLGYTDANGERIIYDAYDTWEWVILSISKPASCFDPDDPDADHEKGYITKNFTIHSNMDGTIQTVCLNDGVPAEPCGEGPTCFTGDTQITLADGTEKPIAHVREGDLILGRSGQPNRVTAIERPRLGNKKLYALNGGDPFVTAEHPFLTEAGWKSIDPDATAAENPHLKLERLAVKDVVLSLQGCAEPVGSSGSGDSVEVVLEPISLVRLDARDADPATQLYNLILDGDHTYFANGFIVHNKCFIVTATTGSSESMEVIQLRQLRDRVSAASRLGAQLIDVIYGEYEQFSPGIAAELQQDETAREAVLQIVVRPLFAWYTLAGTLVFEQADQKAISQVTQNVLNACQQHSGGMGMTIITLLEAIHSGEELPAYTPKILLDLAPQISHLQFASWAILDPLIRVWRSATDGLDVVDEIAQWLATAPIDSLTPPRDPEVLDVDLGALAGFFDFRPVARQQLGKRLITAWPDAAGALDRAGFVSQTPTNK